MSDKRHVAFKYKVKQEYEVIIYYEHGVHADNPAEAKASVEEDVVDLAFNEDGLVVFTDEEAQHSNGFVALIKTHEPETELVYHIYDIPKEIQKELKERKISA